MRDFYLWHLRQYWAGPPDKRSICTSAQFTPPRVFVARVGSSLDRVLLFSWCRAPHRNHPRVISQTFRLLINLSVTAAPSLNYTSDNISSNGPAPTSHDVFAVYHHRWYLIDFASKSKTWNLQFPVGGRTSALQIRVHLTKWRFSLLNCIKVSRKYGLGKIKW